ncbi:MAG: valine--pyruvate transaminase [Spirochaetia bacterium]|nr:valine--pyruvate transaminase [Spirochaetia bacterium]
MAKYIFSNFGKKFSKITGISRLMSDLDTALNQSKEIYFLGGGNPAFIPEAVQKFQKEILKIANNTEEFMKTAGIYDSAQGNTEFIETLRDYLNDTYKLNLKNENIALTNGSQNSFFLLFNLLAGEFSKGNTKKILLPLVPEYIGYSDIGVEKDLFISIKPDIEYLDEPFFKYKINFNSLEKIENISLICLSRPTNPSGNLITDEEIYKLHEIAKRKNIPLMIDNAYGMPFPGIIFEKANQIWDENIILTMSLSKLGLPAARTGIIIANSEIINAVTQMNAVINLSVNSFGPAILKNLIKNKDINHISNNIIKPYYQKKSNEAFDFLIKELNGVPNFKVHKNEGAFFIWLWLKDFPVSSLEFYEILKKRNVFVVPGNYYFPGLKEKWSHKEECLRISYAMESSVVKKGLSIIADEIKKNLAR